MLVLVVVSVIVAVLVGEKVWVGVGVLVGEKVWVGLSVLVGEKVWVGLSVIVGESVTVGVLAGPEGLEGLLLLEGQPRVKKVTPTRSDNTPTMRNFMTNSFNLINLGWGTLNGTPAHKGVEMKYDINVRDGRLPKGKTEKKTPFFREIEI